MIATLLKVLAAVMVAYAVVVLLAWRFQERLAFPAPNAPVPNPASYGISDGQVVTTLTADGLRLRGWYLPPAPTPAAGSTAPGLIWFYGNMETVNALAPLLGALRPPRIGLLVLDYRGYGQSEGKPTERGLYSDAEAAWEFLTHRPEIDTTRIAVYGRSLGSAVALYLATERPIAAVVLDSPLSNAREMADQHYGIIPTSLVRLRLDNLERVSRVEAPLLVFHGTEDRIAPTQMGRAVAEMAPNGRLMLLQGAGHNDTYTFGGERYRIEFHAFLAEHLADHGSGR